MRVIYMGTPDFAVPSLESLYNAGHEIVAVFTQPDKPQGRKMTLTPPEVKVKALELGLMVYQPDTLKDEATFKLIQDLKPDLIAVVAYGKLLPENILAVPKYGCINVHGSLLPKYRGAAPIQWSVINGEKYAGVTTMYMAKELDAGDMLLTYKTEILEDETSFELYERLKIEGAKLLCKTTECLFANEAQRIPQNHEEATYAPMLSKELSKIDFSKNAQIVHNLVRGMNPWPTAYTHIDMQVLKIFKTKLSQKTSDKPCGTVIEADTKQGLFVVCGENTVLEICEVQLVGKKRMSASDFLRGRKIEINTVLGE